MTSVKTYHALAVRRLPALTQLDGHTITARDRHHANTRGASISPSVLRAACKFHPSQLAATPAAAAAAAAANMAASSPRGKRNCTLADNAVVSVAIAAVAYGGVTALPNCAALDSIPVASPRTHLEAHASTTLTLHHNDSIFGRHGEPPLSDAVEVVLQVFFTNVQQQLACNSASYGSAQWR